jgi:hypothetical protein
MKQIDRRKFIKTMPQIAAEIAIGTNGSKKIESGLFQDLTENIVTAIIPMPVQVVIDDVGWWCGKDGRSQQEPYRTGITRDHHPSDYMAIVELGRALKIRPQAAMILCEWDKNNILRKLPTSTWMGENWDNSKWVGPWQEEAADIIRNNSKYFEFTLHGIGHEYWVGNKFTRAEWADRNGTMRPLDQVEKHLDFYAMIMNQHKLGQFPVAFVPTAFYHGYGPTPGHNKSMAEVLKKRGVTYINTPFKDMHIANGVDHGVFGFDSGVITIDRGSDLLGWQTSGQAPGGILHGPTCGMHWANIIHPDPSRNLEVVNEWIKLLAPYNEKHETMLAPNSIFFQNQLAHQVCTKVKLTDNNIELDFKDVDALAGTLSKKELALKVKSQNAMKFKSNQIKIVSQKSIKTEEHFLYTLMLERKKGGDKAQLAFSVSS